MVMVDGISKSFETQLVLKPTTFLLKPNSIVGLCGRNGVGKTTLLKLMLNINIPDTGVIVREYAHAKVIFDMPPQLDSFKIKHFLELFALIYRGEKLEKKEVCLILERVNMRVSPEKKVGKLSFGMKKMLYISTLLLGQTDFAVIDEPFNGLDPISISIVKSIVLEIKEKYGATIIISSHLLNELSEMCEHFLVVKNCDVRYIDDISSTNAVLKITYDNDERMLGILEKFGTIIESALNYCEIYLNDGVYSSDVVQALNQAGIVFREIYYKNVFDI